MKKITDSSVQNITEYENVIREQRQRINSLRDENTALKMQIEALEKEKDNVAGALIAAEKHKAQIIEEAKLRAEKILEAAENSRKKSEMTVKYYCNSLCELEVRCGRILDGISRELNKSDRTNLRLIK